MSGLYFHIPYCRQACHYCDFHFSTTLGTRGAMLEAMARELELRKDYLPAEPLETIYFGGGTPSLLYLEEMQQLLELVRSKFELSPQAEITLEANPDDMEYEKLRFWYDVGFNRLSIGIQSFDPQQLQFLHRVHTSAQAEQCVFRAAEVGFNNISVDLIYGIPALDHTLWKANLERVVRLPITHLSAYCLTIEEKTVFGRWAAQGKLQTPEDTFGAEQFEYLVSYLGQHGFEQYEVSNFSLPGYVSRHNSHYWLGRHYLGIGPGAHSYNGNTRQYTVSSNTLYIQGLEQGKLPATLESLNAKDKANEYLLTRLRTKWGAELDYLLSLGMDISVYKPIMDKYSTLGCLTFANGFLRLTPKGLLIADKIIYDFFQA